jgi:hypothetical protein
MGNKYIKKCSIYLDIGEMQIKTMLRVYLIPVRIVSLRKQLTTTAGEDRGREEPLFTPGRNVNQCSHYGNHYGGYSEKVKIEFPYDLAIPLLKRIKISLIERPVYSCLLWNQPRYSSMDEQIKET